ncbi:hypothetical protein [Dongia rigui]|uniref:Uncharacterized protein n=1 Tax=Dongia rigui TaxID=940149 RepID=A0ABU5E1Q3_9PROT|nr:hypothetical protein [Dongia rigui]MDY0872838.1 hypothetical protein [Dongia rigui]
MIYRINVNDPEKPAGERWFARQVESQFAKLENEPLPAEWQALLKQLSGDDRGRPSS